MQRYAAFLRGVSPMNLKMPQLKLALEDAGFADVKTLLSSGNVVFGARTSKVDTLQTKIEAALLQRVGRSFYTIVRSIDALEAMITADPHQTPRLPAKAKRIVTFLREPPNTMPKLPLREANAEILSLQGLDAFSYYVPIPNDPTFMRVLEKAFGKDITTRTWDTVKKVAGAR